MVGGIAEKASSRGVAGTGSCSGCARQHRAGSTPPPAALLLCALTLSVGCLNQSPKPPGPHTDRSQHGHCSDNHNVIINLNLNRAHSPPPGASRSRFSRTLPNAALPFPSPKPRRPSRRTHMGVRVQHLWLPWRGDCVFQVAEHLGDTCTAPPGAGGGARTEDDRSRPHSAAIARAGRAALIDHHVRCCLLRQAGPAPRPGQFLIVLVGGSCSLLSRCPLHVLPHPRRHSVRPHRPGRDPRTGPGPAAAPRGLRGPPRDRTPLTGSDSRRRDLPEHPPPPPRRPRAQLPIRWATSPRRASGTAAPRPQHIRRRPPCFRWRPASKTSIFVGHAATTAPCRPPNSRTPRRLRLRTIWFAAVLAAATTPATRDMVPDRVHIHCRFELAATIIARRHCPSDQFVAVFDAAA